MRRDRRRRNGPTGSGHHSPSCSRRTFLKYVAAAGAAGWLPAAWPTAHSGQLLRAIPSSGEQVPALGLGTARTFDVGPDAFEREGVREVLREFVALGGRVVDSSPMYGNAETVVGDLAAELGVQDKLFYATKVWTHGRRPGIDQMETSLRLMRIPRVDLMQVHNLVDWRTQLKTCYEWQQAGRIRYVGITHWVADAFDDLERLMRNERLDFVQLPYSIEVRSAEERLLPLAADRGIAVLVNRPFEKGALFTQVRGKPLPAWASEFDCQSWAQYFLKYIVSHPAVTCVIPATRKAKHLRDNMGAGLGRLPDTALRHGMVEHLATL